MAVAITRNGLKYAKCNLFLIDHGKVVFWGFFLPFMDLKKSFSTWTQSPLKHLGPEQASSLEDVHSIPVLVASQNIWFSLTFSPGDSDHQDKRGGWIPPAGAHTTIKTQQGSHPSSPYSKLKKKSLIYLKAEWGPKPGKFWSPHPFDWH